MENMPVAEVAISAELVRALIAEQRPDLAGLPVVAVANGWDNAIFRLGSEYTVRLPRREVAVPLVEHEQRWLPTLAHGLPLPVPAPLFCGRPSAEFPWPWSICPWMDGVIAEGAVFDQFVVAAQLGEFLAALHQPASADAPANQFRGIPLRDRDEILRRRLPELSELVDIDLTLAIWESALTTRPWSGPPLWLHGDLHPANLLVHDGRLSGVIDFGDITAGDPATDLSVAWMLFSAEARSIFRAAHGLVDDDTWKRSRGWALALSIAYMSGSADNPLIFEIGKRTWQSVVADSHGAR